MRMRRQINIYSGMAAVIMMAVVAVPVIMVTPLEQISGGYIGHAKPDQY
jgi:hypothetical protein